MPLIRRPRWQLPDSQLTDEAHWLDRRSVVRSFGLGAIGAAVVSACGPAQAGDGPLPARYGYKLPSFERNPLYPLDRPLTEESIAASYNNFYEFSSNKASVWKVARDFRVRPWSVKISGEVHSPRTLSLEWLLKHMPIEERTYRFRCVEAWSMAVPWVGFPLSALLNEVVPLGKASHVRFVTLDAPDRFPGVSSQPYYPWPYFEGLSLAEAMHPLTLLAVGIYGHPLPNQHGAPIRLIVPWKYGYKSIKSIARIEVVTAEPGTFWSQLVPDEYDFLGNVRPDIPHPRWSQATERVIPSGERIPTLPYNGYAADVAHLYG